MSPLYKDIQKNQHITYDNSKTMKVACIFLFIFYSLTLSGQDLLSSRQTSPYTYIYKLTNSEAGRIIKRGTISGIENGKYFHTPVDSFPTWSDYSRPLSPGYYLKIYSRRNRIEAEFCSMLNINVQIVNNNTDLCIQLYDSTGKITSDALVKIGGRHIGYNKSVNGFLLLKSNRKGILEVSYNGITSFYELSRQINNSFLKRAESRILLTPPLRYVWVPVKVVVSVPVNIVKSLVVSRGYYHPFRNLYYRLRSMFRRMDNSGNYYDANTNGYFVFNKPKYLPGDTVRLKTFIVNRKGRPEKDRLNIYINRHSGVDLKLGRIEPRTPGSYSYNFVLADSFNLDLDRSYDVSLRKGPKNIKSYGRFNYEDYELRNITLKVTTDTENHIRGMGFRVHIRGTDENDLNILDGRLEVTAVCSDIKKIFKERIFVPDTLLARKINLEQLGETVLVIPDSLFPEANLSYTLSVKLLRTDNEYKLFTRNISFYDHISEIDYTLKGDSINFFLKENGKNMESEAVISGADQFGNISGMRRIMLPYSERINPYYKSYKIVTDKITRTLSVNEGLSNVNCISEVSHDSLSINIDNPRDLQFNWFLYSGNKLLEKGYGNEFDYREKISGGRRYFLTIVYLWAGKTVSETIDLTGNKNDLNISVNQPLLVYPGQKTQVVIKVTDHTGSPVRGVDLTAFSLTKKFDFNPPVINRFPDKRKSKDLINSFSVSPGKLNENPGSRLNLDHWDKSSSLDTIEFYKFLYPRKEIYYCYYRPGDGITQFAPFVVKDGEIKKVNVVYVDNVPVYFGWENYGNESYSFKVDTGYHYVEIRTAVKTFRIDSVFFRQGMKLLMSINDVDKPLTYSSTKEEPYLSKIEKINLGRFLFPYRNNFGENFAWLKQNDRVFLLNSPTDHNLNPSGNYYLNNDQQWNTAVTGPLFSKSTDLKVAGGFTHNFLNESGFEYEFNSSLIKMRTTDRQKLLPSVLYGDPIDRLSDIPLNEKRILDSYNEYQFNRKLSTAKFNIPTYTFPGNGKLVLIIDSLSDHLGMTPLFLALLKENNEDNCLVFPGNSRTIHDLQTGIYSLILMFRGEKYARYDSIAIKAGGRTISYLPRPDKLSHDDFGVKLDQVIGRKVYSGSGWPDENFRNYQRQIQREQSISSYTGEGRIVSGVVNSPEGPVAGVTVVVKGTTIGTVTDINGFYSLKVPYSNRGLQFSFIGFKSVERDVDSENINISMEQDMMALNEVVVMGYGLSKTRLTLASSVSTVQSSLSGRVAGVQISNLNGLNDARIMIRGNTSFDTNNRPLIIIDGKPYLGDLSVLDPSLIRDMKVIKDESMLALYGASAANGVVIISTSGMKLANSGLKSFLKGADYGQEFMNEVAASGSIRSNFSDYAYWKPDLTTDKSGKASFEIKFPDDVTNWSTYVMAMNARRQSGQTNGSVKSYKPLMAQMFTPRFLIEGDSANIIGKILNYTPDTVSVKATTEFDGRTADTKTVTCINAIMDTIPLIAHNPDTIKAKYYFTKPDGYLDGEERKIPVFRKGIELAKGEFFVLERDTTINIIPDPALGGVTVYAQSDQLDVLNDEIEGLNSYHYECNEQLASRLKGLIAQETVCKYKNIKFNRKIHVNRIIRLLEKNQNQDGCWGWWNKSETCSWISVHVAEALMQAKAKGYNVNFNMQSLTDYVVWTMETKLENSTKLDLLYLMSFTNSKINFTQYLSEYNEDSFRSLTDKFRFIELKQKFGLKYSADSVFRYEKKTIFGNIYFGDKDTGHSICNNEVQTALTAYRIIRHDSLRDENYLGKMRNFFFERRKPGRWQNTFETARIIETIIPDLLITTEEDVQKQKIVLTGAINKNVEEFPFEIKLGPRDSVKITKSGIFPIYITSYQHYWKTDPSADTSRFSIETRFEDNNLTMTAGKPEKMKVSLRVAKDAQYVMVEVPIPGGSSYESKNGYFRGSCHTEFYKNHISIFFDSLRPGNYEFEIELLPRYTGKYTINPAKAELMYFPLFSSNNALKQIVIK